MRAVCIKAQHPEGRTDNIFLYLINLGDRDIKDNSKIISLRVRRWYH